MSYISNKLILPATLSRASLTRSASALADHGDKITATAMGNISMRPDLMRTYLRHLDLAGYDIPAKPEAWRPGAEAQTSFWLGYYHSRSQGR